MSKDLENQQLRKKISNLLISKGYQPHMTSFSVLVPVIEYFIINETPQKTLKEAYEALPEINSRVTYNTIAFMLRKSLTEVDPKLLYANNPGHKYTSKTFITQCVNEILYGELPPM